MDSLYIKGQLSLRTLKRVKNSKEDQDMSSMEIATLIISGISAMANIIQAWKTSQNAGIEMADIEEISQVPSTSPDNTTYTPSASATAMSHVIDSNILQSMLDNINAEKERLGEALTDRSNSNQEKDRAVGIASSLICSELSRIKSLNGGRLPGSDLEALWLSFGCN